MYDKLAQIFSDVAEKESQRAFEQAVLCSDKHTLFSYLFKTKNNKQVVKVFKELGFDKAEIVEGGILLTSFNSIILDSQYVIKNKKTGKLIGAYDNFDYFTTKDYLNKVHNKNYKLDEKVLEDYIVLPLINYIQDMLRKGEFLAYIETQSCYYENNAYATIISKTDKRVFDLRLIMDNYLQNIDGKILKGVTK